MSSQQRKLSWLEKTRLDLVGWVHRKLTAHYTIDDKSYRSTFVCETRLQAYRAITLWTKEPGTMAWIDKETRAGDRFLDIGANMGIYTISAAHRVGAQGRVYAVEPHKPTAVTLMRNILANKLQDRIDVITVALGDRRFVAPFNYKSFESSETGSQLGTTLSDGGARNEFSPVTTELCLATTIDDLIEMGAIKAPHLVKIDVDGLELNILAGMSTLLQSAERPRGVQVELNVGEQDAIINFFTGVGYQLDHRHFTMHGEGLRAKGVDVAKIAHNAVFVPRS